MVYFGPRRYRSARPGLSRSDRIRIFAPVLLLVALVGFLYSPGADNEVDGSLAPVIPITSETDAEVDLPSLPGSQVPQAETLPLPVDPNHPPAPFIVREEVLAAVRDAEILDAGEREREGLVYLFHRWRSGAQVASAEFPEWTRFPLEAHALRGTRHSLILTLIDSPRKFSLDDNPSGVLRYWQAFGQDSHSHLHKVNFINKSGRLPGGTDVVFEGDFLRMYRYITRSEIEAQVPEWVTTDLSAYRAAPSERSGDGALKIVGGISLLGLVVILLMGRGDPPRPRPTRRVAKRGKDGD